ncbi:MAG: S-layer homology domain-containing protein [Akkermansia sp.]|nr:S-layer homology domain-containing protein [Akkermansia sp.]
MKNIYRLLLTMFCLLLGFQAHAQIEMQLQPVRKDFIVGENVALKITITNQTDASITLKNTPGRPCPEAEYSDIFTDVKESDWCAPAIMWAYKNGITTGTGDGRFDPAASVTREQIAVFLYRFISEYKREPQEISGNLDAFTDKDDVSPYAGFAEAVTWAVDSGLISGKNEFGVIRLAPRDVAQRCETAAVIARFHEGFVK